MKKTATKAEKAEADGLVKFSVSMPAELVERIDARARAEHRSRSNAVTVLVLERLAELAKGGAA